MTTDADTEQQTGLAELARAIGRLEGTTAALVEGQRQLVEGQRQLQVGLDAVNRRVDRLLFAIIAVGGAAVAAIFASRFVGG